MITKNAYEQVTATPFTVIPGVPSWRDVNVLVEEMKRAALEHEVSYPWAKDYSLLAEIEGTAQYLVTSGETYVPQVKPAHTDARLTGTRPQPTAALVRVYQNKNDVKKEDWATTVGIRRGIGKHWRNCLQPRYWEQLEQTTFKWKRISSRIYIEHLLTGRLS